MATNITQRRAPGAVQPFVALNPSPVIANVAPTTFDNYEPSTIWIQQTDIDKNPVNAIWILASVQNGSANWVEVAPSGGPGVFEYIQLPNTDVGGTIGYISFGGDRFVSNLGLGSTFVGANSGSVSANQEAAEYNTALGFNALSSLDGGSRNTGIGAFALEDNDVLSDCVAVGWQAAASISTSGPDGTVAIGSQALRNLTSGISNVAVGFQAANNQVTNNFTTAVGHHAFLNHEGDSSVAVGAFAMGGTGGSPSTRCVAIGFQALLNSSGATDCLGIGSSAGSMINNGQANCLVGNFAGTSVGDGNTAIGNGSLSNATGDNNVAIGFNAGSTLGTGNNCIHIANDGTGLDNNTIKIGSGLQQTCFISGIASATFGGGTAVFINTVTGQLGLNASSLRYKENIQPISDELSSKIYELREVSFDYKDNDESSIGLIAEEVDKLIPDLVSYDVELKPNGVKYDLLSVLLLKELKKLKQEVELLKNK